MSGGSTVQAPQPSAQQLELEQQQANLLQQQNSILTQQQSTQKLLNPFLYQALGLTPQTDSSGNITGFTQDPQVASISQQQRDLTSQLLGFEKTSLDQVQNGTAPIDPELTRQLQLGDNQVNNQLEANLGPGFASSSPGIQALNDWAQRKAGINFEASHGQLTFAQQLQLAQSGSLTGNSGGAVSSLSATQGPTFGALSLGAGLSNAFTSAQSPYVAQQQQQLQAEISNQQSQNQLLGGFGQLFGLLGGSAAMSPWIGTALGF